MEFRILGPTEVLSSGEPLSLGGSKQRALLGMLLLHANEVVSTDRLIDELWSGEGGDEPVKALQVAVSRLRKALEPGRAPDSDSGVVVTRSPGYELRVDAGRLDATRFEALMDEGRQALGSDPEAARAKLDEALCLWRGPPLADLAYESFCQAEISRLQELRVAALEDRIAADLELGRHAQVVGELRALVSEEPLRERPRAQLMLALYRSGRQAEALEAYRETRRVLVGELGIEPGRDLKDMERAILAQDPALDVPERGPKRAPAQQRRGVDGLVGREPEMAELLSLLDGSLSGSGSLVLIGGEPGAGKSRLTDALGTEVRARGCHVLVGRCWEAGGAPAYWPWVQALRSFVRDADPDAVRSALEPGGGELATIVPEIRDLLPDLPAPSGSASEGSRFRLFDSVASFLRSAAAAEPVALFLDDLQAADVPSLLLLRFMAGELRGARILIVGCYRDTEVAPGHALAEALPELAREAAVRRISLKGLSQADTARLVELTMGRTPPGGLAAQVHAQTEGNPLFVVELARLLASEDRAGQGEGQEDRLPIPDGVREAIGRRLERESDRCRQVLTLASVLGREFALDALGRVSGLTEDDLFEALDEAAAARLVDDLPGARERLRFSHVLIRDTVYESLPATRRLRLHRQVGVALEALYAGNLEPHLSELALHYREAGTEEADRAIRYAMLAGDRACAQLGFEEAAHHYRSALESLETLGPRDAARLCDVLLSLGEVLSRAGDDSEAKEAFRRAAGLAEESRQPERLARAALGYGGRFLWGRGRSAPALVPLLERALQAVGEDDSPVRVRLLTRLATALRDEKRRDRRVGLAGDALDMARRIGDPVTLAYALEGHWPAVGGPEVGRIELADELVALAEEIGDKERAYTGHEYRFNTSVVTGDRVRIAVELDAMCSIADELHQPTHGWSLHSDQAVLALMEGRFEQADNLLSRALTLGGRSQSWNAGVSQRIGRFVLCREQGRLEELEATFMRAVHEYPTLPRFRSALAHLYAQLGRRPQARAAFDDVLPAALAREYVDEEWLFGVSLLPDVCVFLGDDAAAARLYALLAPYESFYALAPAEAPFGSVARGLGVLATELGRFDDAQRHFTAALELERRMGARPWVAHVLHDHASMLLARRAPGDLDGARLLLDEAGAAYRELGMDVWAARCTALAGGTRTTTSRIV